LGREIFGSQRLILREVAAFTTHGGAIDAAQRLFPKGPRPWIDLSTGINNVPYPVGPLPGSTWSRLPDDTELRRLEDAAGRRYGVPLGISAIAAPGAQAIIQHLPSLCGGHDVRILGHTYREFERVFQDAERLVRIVPEADALAGADVAIVVNPNNPDGRLLPAPELLALSERVGTLVVDETYMDALPASCSVAPRLPATRMIVLRSFGKIYGLAGLRLGFALASADHAYDLRRLLGPWAVSGPALAIGLDAMGDATWLDDARTRLEADAARLMYLLRHIDATPVGGTPLFRLVAHPAAPALFTALAEAGILVRPFTGAPNWLRFGFPGTEAAWTRLETAVRAFH
jgi:cobalamin biosynthetic protein CobC